MATGCPHPFGGRVPRHPFWKHRDTGAVHGPAYVSLSATATASATDPGDAARAANKTAILAAAASAVAQNKALLVDGLFWWDAGASTGLNLSYAGLKIIGRTAQCFSGVAQDGFVGKVSTAPTSPKNGLSVSSTVGQEFWSLLIAGVGASVRGSATGDHAFQGFACDGLRVVGCQAITPTAAGFIFFTCDDTYVGRGAVVDSLADAFHFSGASTRGYAEVLSALRPGDDYCAAVSYTTDSAFTRDITFRCVTGSGQVTSGRGLACVGGKNVLFEDGNIIGAYAQGLYACAEAGTAGVNDVTFRRCTAARVGVSGSNGHGAYVGAATGSALGEAKTAQNVTYDDCTVLSGGTGGKGLAIVGASGVPAGPVTAQDGWFEGTTSVGVIITGGIDVTLSANTIRSNKTVAGSMCLLVDGGCHNLTIDSNLVTFAHQWGIRMQTVALTGDTIITGNEIRDISSSGANPEGFIDPISWGVNQTSGTITISGNTHNNPNSNEYNWDWDLAGQTTTLSTLVCTNNVRGTNTGGVLANYAVTGGNQDAGTGIRVADPNPGWTLSGNT